MSPERRVQICFLSHLIVHLDPKTSVRADTFNLDSRSLCVFLRNKRLLTVTEGCETGSQAKQKPKTSHHGEETTERETERERVCASALFI